MAVKRILLVTFSRNASYGGTLQEFALFKHLNQRYETQCLDYVNPLVRSNSRAVRTAVFAAFLVFVRKLFARRPMDVATDKKAPSMTKYYIRDGMNLLKVFLSDIINYRSRASLIRSFWGFWEQYIPYTRPYSEKRLFSDPPKNYDVYIAGGDQIWNPVKFGLSQAYFLRFAPSGARKISYSSSFANFHFQNDITSKAILSYLRDYAAVSAREAHSCDELRELGVNAEHVLDPTLLLTKEMWADALGLNLPVQPTIPYLLVYAMNDHQKVYEYAIEVARSLSLAVRILGSSKKEIPGVSCVPDASPREFVELLRNAAFVVTNSFHGTAFSINFNIPFFCVESNLPERIDSLLKLTDLTSRARSFREIGGHHRADMSLDFSNANKVIAAERERSILYLERAINAPSEEEKK